MAHVAELLKSGIIIIIANNNSFYVHVPVLLFRTGLHRLLFLHKQMQTYSLQNQLNVMQLITYHWIHCIHISPFGNY